jgi:hypothetical protein
MVIGNPMCDNLTKEQVRIEVLRRLPKLKKLDALVVSEQEREAAAGTTEEKEE